MLWCSRNVISVKTYKIIGIIIFGSVILFYSDCFSQEEPRYSLWLGYERFIPVAKASDIFKKKTKRMPTEIQTGNGITANLYYRWDNDLTPYIRTGYTWHSKLNRDTLILANHYSQEIRYSIIPVSAGAEYHVFSKGYLSLLIIAEGNYYFITRKKAINELDYLALDKMNNFGYSIGLNPMLLSKHHLRLGLFVGFAKKGSFSFWFAKLSFPVLPFSYFLK